jgi:hypothetical protein
MSCGVTTRRTKRIPCQMERSPKLREYMVSARHLSHKVHVNCISHVTLRHRLTHLGCVYNRSMKLPQYNNLLPLSSCLLCHDPNTWEPLINLNNCQQKIKEYRKGQKKQSQRTAEPLLRCFDRLFIRVPLSLNVLRASQAPDLSSRNPASEYAS